MANSLGNLLRLLAPSGGASKDSAAHPRQRQLDSLLWLGGPEDNDLLWLLTQMSNKHTSFRVRTTASTGVADGDSTLR